MDKQVTATELEYLTWLAQNIDFGPAHGDVIMELQAQFENETGTRVPKEWRCEWW